MNKKTEVHPQELSTRIFHFSVIVAALGYFVDIYDLILFGVVRVKSLISLGITDEDQIKSIGQYLLNMQMIGMLIGGILWGILGDKRGRISVLFGSILLYSLANIANAFVTDVEMYGWMRLLAGIGLAGELGAGITLVSETMTKERRGYGTMLVVSFGVTGAVLAGLIGRNFEWQTAYIIGGVLGLALLVLRIGVFESGMFAQVKQATVSRGNFFKLFSNWSVFKRYLSCISIGIPIWFMIGILITLSPEFAKELHIDGVKAGDAIMWFYLGTTFGDFMSGYLSQVFKNRKKIVLMYLGISIIMIPVYLLNPSPSLTVFYVVCSILGIAAGYWAVFVTIASEQFGTNIRSTVTTTVPNFVRGSLPLLNILLNFFTHNIGLSMVLSAFIVGGVSIIIALISLTGLKETWGKDLNYHESH